MKLFSVRLKTQSNSKLLVGCGMTAYREFSFGKTDMRAYFDHIGSRGFDVPIVKSYNETEDKQEPFSDSEMPSGTVLKTGSFYHTGDWRSSRIFVPTETDTDNAAIVFFGGSIVKPYTSMITNVTCLNENDIVKNRLDFSYGNGEKSNSIPRCSHCGQGLLDISSDNIDIVMNKIPESVVKEEIENNFYPSKSKPKPTEEDIKRILSWNRFHLKHGTADVATCSKELNNKVVKNKEFLSAFRIDECYFEQMQNGSDVLVVPNGTEFDFISQNNNGGYSYFNQGHIKYENGKLSVTTKIIEKLPFYKVEE